MNVGRQHTKTATKCVSFYVRVTKMAAKHRERGLWCRMAGLAIIRDPDDAVPLTLDDDGGKRDEHAGGDAGEEVKLDALFL